MGFMRSFLNSTPYLKIMLFVSLPCVAFAWTSFVTAAWGDFDHGGSNNNITGYGLWSRCNNAETSPDCIKLVGWNLEWYRATQAFALLGFVSVNLTFFFIILLMFLPECSNSKSLTVWVSVLAFWAALCYIVAIIIFGASFDDKFTTTGGDSEKLQYGWGLAIAVAVLEAIIGVLDIFQIRQISAKFLDL